MRIERWIVLCAACILIAGCSRKAAEQRPGGAEVALTYSANGWTQAERDEYYHLAEGSELMPYALIANVKSSTTGKPFLEDMERFGFLPDHTGPMNPHGLPVGVTVSRSRNAGTAGIEIIGFNCAACHVAELTYQGKRVRVDGAPGMVNLQQYQIEFKNSLDTTLHSPQKLVALILAMDQEQHASDTPSGGAAGQYAAEPEVRSAGDVQAVSSADPSFHSISSAAADKAQPASRGNFQDRLKTDIAFLKARLAYLKKGSLLIDGTEPGPGRVDAFGAARNLLFPQYAMKMQSPVSYPFIWSIPDNIGRKPADFEWIHYDGNTNSILERNIGQSLGMGSVFDPVTYESTLRLANLHQLEMLTHKLQPPQWPAEVLGNIDQSKAEQGRQIFQEKCASCHQNRFFPQMQIGTDPNRANSFGQPVGKTPFPKAVAPILDKLKQRAYADDGITPAEQAKMDADPVVWRSTGQYLARPLNGIWATGPYLHNGSVPTLYDLLHPDQRPAKFNTGGLEFDPVKVGYRSDSTVSGANVWVFDTSQPGNSNIGHSGEVFGTTLPEDQKAALLEYLKKL
ncbi:MAG TPA: di-heme-cytochrome C peroxidase [Bryobacteraceae bacterium]|nr:di-heme-cytochrome C peroxidase [Bryobacteraceae bacterium]